MLDAILTSGNSENSKRNEVIKSFIEARFESLSVGFVSSLAQCNAAAKVPRLRSLANLLGYVQSGEQRSFLRQILPEVILSMKEVNEKSRDAALSLVKSMLKLWQKMDMNAEPAVAETDSLRDFFHLVMVGLAASTNMISCSCLALSSLTYEFKGNDYINDSRPTES